MNFILRTLYKIYYAQYIYNLVYVYIYFIGSVTPYSLESIRNCHAVGRREKNKKKFKNNAYHISHSYILLYLFVCKSLIRVIIPYILHKNTERFIIVILHYLLYTKFLFNSYGFIHIICIQHNKTTFIWCVNMRLI